MTPRTPGAAWALPVSQATQLPPFSSTDVIQVEHGGKYYNNEHYNHNYKHYNYKHGGKYYYRNRCWGHRYYHRSAASSSVRFGTAGTP